MPEFAGFRIRRVVLERVSTVTTPLEATYSWAFDIDHGHVNSEVFLDLKKDFDTVGHDILFSKLNPYGIHGIALHWFKSYLTNRTQRCLANGTLSNICSLKCGVPLATILGPLLFLIHNNDLPNCLSSWQPRLYADDTHITCVGADVNSFQLNLNHDLDNLNKSIKLSLNTSKTEFMLIGSRQKLSTLSNPLELSIDNVPVVQVSPVKLL